MHSSGSSIRGVSPDALVADATDLLDAQIAQVAQVVGTKIEFVVDPQSTERP